MKILFKKIRWKNFLSTGNYWNEIPLDQAGVTLIVGANGSGKSTLLDAISFALFNKPFRRINKAQLVNSLNNKDCVVELFLEVGNKDILVRRGIKPNIFEVEVNGSLQEQLADARDQQQWFEHNVVNISPTAFSQIVVLSATNFVPFLDLPAAARRQFVEDLIQLRLFSVMNVLEKQARDNTAAELQSIKYAIDMKNSAVAPLIKAMDQVAENNNWLLETQLSALEKFETTIKETKNQRDAIPDTSEAVTELMSQLKTKQLQRDKLRDLATQTRVKNDGVIKHIGFFENNDECPTCTQSIEADFKSVMTTSLLDKKKQGEDVLTKIKDKIEQVDSEVIEVEKQITLLRNQLELRNTLTNELSWQMRSREKVQDTINKIKNDINASADYSQIESLKAEIALLETQHAEKQTKISLHDETLRLLRDDGIKSDIIRYYIPIINETIERHLNMLDFYVTFKLDENFNEILTGNQEQFQYASFSEGEKSRIDLALLFAWREIALRRNSINTNLLVLDEVLDSSMDSVGIEMLFEMLEQINASVVVISHREAFVDKIPSYIKFEKSGYFSRILC